MTAPLISVAMATYNGEKYLREQIDSILAQTHKNIEFIVCDDRSTDNTVAILREYQQLGKLSYSVNEKNLGYYHNFERALSLCHGDYIALADQDDIWLPNKLEILLNEIGTNSLIASDALLVDKNNEILQSSFKSYANLPVVYEYDFLRVLHSGFITGCTIMLRREMLNHAMPFPKSIQYHDWWLGFVGFKTGGTRYIDQQLIRYRQHDNNQIGAELKLSKGNNSEGKMNKLERSFRNYLEYELGCIKRYSELLIYAKALQFSNEEISYLKRAIAYAELPFKNYNSVFMPAYVVFQIRELPISVRVKKLLRYTFFKLLSYLYR